MIIRCILDREPPLEVFATVRWEPGEPPHALAGWVLEGVAEQDGKEVLVSCYERQRIFDIADREAYWSRAG